jgi:hypothetical protein
VSDYFTIDQLAGRLKIEPESFRALLSEIAEQLTKEYLTIDQLAGRLSVEKKTIKNKMATGIFQKGVHYFSPNGLSPRFKWSAVVAWLESTENNARGGIPMRKGYSLNPATDQLWENGKPI